MFKKVNKTTKESPGPPFNQNGGETIEFLQECCIEWIKQYNRFNEDDIDIDKAREDLQYRTYEQIKQMIKRITNLIDSKLNNLVIENTIKKFKTRIKISDLKNYKKKFRLKAQLINGTLAGIKNNKISCIAQVVEVINCDGKKVKGIRNVSGECCLWINLDDEQLNSNWVFEAIEL